MKTQSPWLAEPLPSFPRLTANRKCDVVVVGGGITGLTVAYLLKLAGKTGCVLERDRLALADTGHTTAHLSYVTDLRISKLAQNFGQEAARLVWEGGAAAINTIESLIDAESIDCGFQRVPGFLHAALRGESDEADALQHDYELARELGFHATYLEQVPVVGKPGIRFSNQGKFHPRQYLAGLAKAIDGDGWSIYEQAEVTEVVDKPRAVKVGGLTVECDHLVLATHVPLMGATGLLSATLMQTKLAPYSSYALQAEVPAGQLPAALFWDTSDPYYYLRVDAAADVAPDREVADADGSAAPDTVIFGGEDHKTGQATNTEAPFLALQDTLFQILPEARIVRRWSGQVVETNDGLPYIGETAQRQYVATGFSGNGMTFGTLAAMMICDQIVGNDNPWADLFDVSRKKLRGGMWDYLKENFDYPYYLIKDRFSHPDAKTTRDVKRGEGRILRENGQWVACSRDDKGKLKKVSATCTHMGCLVRWNDAEKTWDCPCHGSRFQANGKVLAGPAETPLEAVKPTPRAKAGS